jgi:hypothetical protein
MVVQAVDAYWIDRSDMENYKPNFCMPSEYLQSYSYLQVLNKRR